MKYYILLVLNLLAFNAHGQSKEGDPEVYRIRLGLSDSWIIRGESAVMIDAGMQNHARGLERQLRKLPFPASEIKLLVITHGHFDHIGLAGTIRYLTGAKILIHESDRPMLEEGRFIVPQGITQWGRLSRKLFMPMMKKRAEGIPPVKADIVMGNQPFPMDEYGIKGKIIYTPGHTMGSVSVVLDNGNAFVSCLAHNRLPFTLKPQLPIYADYPELFPGSWQKVKDLGARMIHPGHGRAFKIDKMNFPKNW